MTSKKLFGFLATNGTMSVAPMSLVPMSLMPMSLMPMSLISATLMLTQPQPRSRPGRRSNNSASAKEWSNQELNGMSRRIYNDKHNAESARYGNNEVDARRHNQQRRIGEGIESGKLNASQAAKLESKESAINREVRQDRQGNGGRRTRSEHARVSRQINRTSGQIYRAKQR